MEILAQVYIFLHYSVGPVWTRSSIFIEVNTPVIFDIQFIFYLKVMIFFHSSYWFDFDNYSLYLRL